MNAIDTNIWIYCHDRRDSRKQKTARDLVLGVQPMGLLWQVGCEFVAAARKLEPFGFTQQMAWNALADMQAMADEVLLPDPESWTDAEELQSQYQLQFWDALLLAGCVRGAVTTLYSEDFSEHEEIHGIRIVDPFDATETQ